MINRGRADTAPANQASSDSEGHSRGRQKKTRRFILPLGRQLILLFAGVVVVTVFVSVYVGYLSARTELHQEVDYFLLDRAEEFIGIQANENQSDVFQSTSSDVTPQAFLTLWGEARELFDTRASSLLRNDSWMQLLVYDTELGDMVRLPLGGYGFFPLPAEAMDWDIAMGTREAAYTTRKVEILEQTSTDGSEAGEGNISQAEGDPASNTGISYDFWGALYDFSRARGFTPNTGISGNTDGWLNTVNEDGSSSPTASTAASTPADSASATVTETLNLRIYTVQIGSGVALQIGRDLHEIDNAIGDLRDRVIRVGLAITLIAALFGWILGRRIVKPVKQLAVQTENITETLDLATAVEVKGSAEVTQLAISFNKMLSTLYESRERRRQLIADVSHELRTPLTSMRTNIEMLTKDMVADPEERKAVLADTKAEIEEFSVLADELMELTRIDMSRGLQHETEGVILSLDDLAREAAERAHRQSHREIVVTAEEPQEVFCHENDIKRAMGNLLSNAAKFSPEDSPIEMNVTGTKLEVRDHGSGINPDNSQKIFARFYREEKARSMPGSGLGLAIVSQIMEIHGGEVWAKNHPEGGAVVGFSLPPVEENGQA